MNTRTAVILTGGAIGIYFIHEYVQKKRMKASATAAAAMTPTTLSTTPVTSSTEPGFTDSAVAFMNAEGDSTIPKPATKRKLMVGGYDATTGSTYLYPPGMVSHGFYKKGKINAQRGATIML